MERNTETLRLLLGTHAHSRHSDYERQLLGRQLNRVCCPRSSFLEQENAVFHSQRLLERRAFVDYPDDEGRSALQHAAEHGWPYLVHVLLQAGADIEHPDHNRHTALHIAAWHGRFDMVDFLIAQRADVAALDEYGNTPFMVAHEHVGMTRDLCNCQNSGYLHNAPMETDRTCWSPYYEELWKLEAARDDLARVAGLGERRHFVRIQSDFAKIACLTGEYEIEADDNKTRTKITVRLFNNFRTPYKGRDLASRFSSVLLFGPDGGCDLQQSRQETHSHSGSLLDIRLMVDRRDPPRPLEASCYTLEESLATPTYDQLWALRHDNDREPITALTVELKHSKMLEAWTTLEHLIRKCSRDELSADEHRDLERLLLVTGGSPAISSGRKLRRKRQASAVFWAIVAKGVKGRAMLITFLYLFYFALIFNVEITAADPPSCMQHMGDDDYWDEHDCRATACDWHFEEDVKDIPWLLLCSVAVFTPYLLYFAVRAVVTYWEAMAGIVPWKKLSRLLETDEQLPTVPLCDHPSDPRWLYRKKFDRALDEAAKAARGLADAKQTKLVVPGRSLEVGTTVEVKATSEKGTVVRVEETDPDLHYKIELAAGRCDWFAKNAVVEFVDRDSTVTAADQPEELDAALAAMETTGQENWRQDTFHEKIPWLEEMDSQGAYFALLECGAIRDEEDFSTLIQQGVNHLFDRPFPQDFCDAMEFWRHVYKLWLLAHSERLRPTFEALLEQHLPGAKLGPRKSYGRIRLKELHHRTQCMRDVEHRHMDHMPSFDEMTIAAHVHDFLRARLLVATEADVVAAVEKMKALNYSTDRCSLLRVENGFRPDEGHFTREVRLYLLLGETARVREMSAVAELQIRLQHEEPFWERVHIIERARRGDYH
eukprot:TRINITY_DN48022_c0_g1_i1.p1 TRINITY_DN48022_c0_g1~~TRINITY_DN48022_c0_g1_i1.p1  ORF type:complete len:1000 (+),score=137.93 TRINITY_DN48022_c0_g1_i1:350-3001(+)